MKGTNQFERFDREAFFKDKDCTVTGVSQWLDHETKKPLGWRVDTVVTRDDTQYRTKDDRVISNLYQTQAIKCREKPDVKVGDVVVPDGDVTCVLYGQYRNEISIKCDSVKVVTPAARKDKA